jgi:hypothetical protein
MEEGTSKEIPVAETICSKVAASVHGFAIAVFIFFSAHPASRMHAYNKAAFFVSFFLPIMKTDQKKKLLQKKSRI